MNNCRIIYIYPLSSLQFPITLKYQHSLNIKAIHFLIYFALDLIIIDTYCFFFNFGTISLYIWFYLKGPHALLQAVLKRGLSKNVVRLSTMLKNKNNNMQHFLVNLGRWVKKPTSSVIMTVQHQLVSHIVIQLYEFIITQIQ